MIIKFSFVPDLWNSIVLWKILLSPCIKMVDECIGREILTHIMALIVLKFTNISSSSNYEVGPSTIISIQNAWSLPIFELLPCPLKLMIGMSESSEVREADVVLLVGSGYDHNLWSQSSKYHRWKGL